ncbi:MAG TPA: terminase gpA endonuclease subunit, partial [Devosia sp.]
GANSAAGLRSMPVRFLDLDEIDAYPDDVEGEGSPISLAEKRTVTFGSRKKIYKISTPTIKGRSRISNEFATTDQRYFFVPCPHCAHMQILRFPQLRWEKEKYSVDDVYYLCETCEGKIYERHKTAMLTAGEWRPTAPELVSRIKRGYHLSALYSPDGWLPWADIAKQYDEAEGDEPKIKTFTNTILGEEYEEKSEAPEWQQLYERASGKDGQEANKPAASVAFITAGADVQADRIEVELVGWSEGRTSYQIDYRVLMGDPDKPEVWAALDTVLNDTWTTEDGRLLGVRLMAIDTGFKTDKVYDYVKRHGTSRVVPVKGKDELQAPFAPPRVVELTKQGQKLGRLKVWQVGVSYLKGQFYGWLRLVVDHETGEIPKGFCFFTPRDAHYFRGLTAETTRPVRNKKGYIQHVWVKLYERNEPLDCRIYALSAAYITGFDRWTRERWAKEKNMAPKHVPDKTDEPKAKPSKPNRKPKSSGYWS